MFDVTNFRMGVTVPRRRIDTRRSEGTKWLSESTSSSRGGNDSKKSTKSALEMNFTKINEDM